MPLKHCPDFIPCDLSWRLISSQTIPSPNTTELLPVLLLDSLSRRSLHDLVYALTWACVCLSHRMVRSLRAGSALHSVPHILCISSALQYMAHLLKWTAFSSVEQLRREWLWLKQLYSILRLTKSFFIHCLIEFSQQSSEIRRAWGIMAILRDVGTEVPGGNTVCTVIPLQ